jgi:hypothetical protein
MRNIDVDIIAEIEKEVAMTFFLLELNLTADYYFTDADQDIFYDGNLYLSVGFDFSDIAYAANMSVDKISLNLDNAGLYFSTLFLGEDVRNKTAKLSFGIKYGIPFEYGVIDLFQGIISDWNSSELKTQLTVVNEFILWKKKTLRIAQATCPWDFKGTECAYAGGETWCDKSYDRCMVLSNTNNFGGFRFLPSIAEKEIWWGRVQA